MEQRHPAPGAHLAQASRTVLPGEPFDPPEASAVPGPRTQPDAPEYGYEPQTYPGAAPHPQFEAPAGEIPVAFLAPPVQPQYEQPQYEQPQYEQPQYEQPQHQQPQYEQPQYGQPYAQPQFEAPQPQQQYAAPQYGQPYEPPQFGQPQQAAPMNPVPMTKTAPVADFPPPASFETPVAFQPTHPPHPGTYAPVEPIEAMLPPATYPAPAAYPAPEPQQPPQPPPALQAYAVPTFAPAEPAPMPGGYEPPAPTTFTPLPTYGVQLDPGFDSPQHFAAPAPAFPEAPAHVGPAGDMSAPAFPPPFPPPAPGFDPEPVHPLTPLSADDGNDGEGPAADGKRRAKRGPDRKLLALLALVVVAGGGYFGYTQLNKSSDSTDTPTSVPTAAAPSVRPTQAPASAGGTGTAATGQYGFPKQLSGYTQQTSAAATRQAQQLKAFAAQQLPAIGKTAQVSVYASGTPGVVATTYRPAAANLASAYSTLLANVRKPAAGNRVGAFTAVAPGAAGGSMTCGGQSGASPIAYCVFRGTSAVGMVYMTGTPKPAMVEIITREMRAYAEH